MLAQELLDSGECLSLEQELGRQCELVEVLSRATARSDRSAKATDCRALPSCPAVMLVAADRVCIERWRKDEAGVWGMTIHGPPDRVPLPHGEWVPVNDVYEGVPLGSAGRFA